MFLCLISILSFFCDEFVLLSIPTGRNFGFDSLIGSANHDHSLSFYSLDLRFILAVEPPLMTYITSLSIELKFSILLPK